NNMTRAEVILWSKLRGKQLNGLKFRRQYSVGPYVVDFYCAEIKLAIELDGDTHFGEGAEKRDAERERYIQGAGIRVIRFTNYQINRELECVLDAIDEATRASMHPDPPKSPLVKGGLSTPLLCKEELG